MYECRNLDTGEMMAVKQMSVQEKDSGTLQSICDEIGIFQKVSHRNIVQFHGLEIHHVSYITILHIHHVSYITIHHVSYTPYSPRELHYYTTYSPRELCTILHIHHMSDVHIHHMSYAIFTT